VYIRIGKLEAGSWKGAGNMWIIGAGIMVCGLLSMVFAPMLLSFAVMGIGALIAWACSEEEHREESKRNAWRKTYPTYKY
jgi:Na+-transporting methylmalonyl-CoA/oxaloacetate decarboxylase gamma subunit